jgi:exodeoxyribonuclease V alpha subunit
LVLIGDPNQLPSVEKGAVINDLIDTLNKDSKLVTHLTKSNRQKIQENGQKSKIQSVAEEIIKLKASNTSSEELNEKYPTLFNQINPIPDSIRLENFQKTKSLVQNKESHEQIVRLQIDVSKITNFRDGMLKILWNEIFLKQIEEITKWNLKNLNDLNSLEVFNKFQSIINHFRCLTVYRKGYFGVQGLNQGIETLAKNELYPRQGSKTNFYWSIQRRNLSSKLYYTGLPILIIENDTSRKLFNGDIGLILPIGEENNSELRAIFAIDNQLISFAIDTLPKHEDAYFLSVHKSQGSEYDELLIYLPPTSKSVHSDEEASLMNRQILYTAITRARNKVYLACDEGSWNSSLQNNLTRITGFKL